VNRTGSISIVVVVLVLALIAAAGWFLLREDGPDPSPSDPSPKSQEAEAGESNTTSTDKAETPIRTSRGSGSSSANQGAVIPSGRKGLPTELRGRVLDAFKNPIEDASIQIIHYDFDQDPTKRIHERFIRRIIHQTATDEKGEWKFEELTPTNRHYISASAPGYLESIKDNVEVGLLVDFTLRKGARVQGTVVDEDTGKPVEGARVRGWYKTGNSIRDVNQVYRWQEMQITKADGSYVFEGAPVAMVKWMLYHKEYEDYSEDIQVQEGTTNEFKFAMKRGVTIEGIVKDKLNDVPLAGVDVQVTDILVPKFATKTDENGRFRVTGLAPTTQIFTFRKAGFTAMRAPTAVSPGDNFDPQQNNVFEFLLDPAGRAAGIVYDPNGNPIDNARVFVARENPLMKQIRGKHEFRTQTDGQFLVQDLGTDTNHVIVAYREDYGIGVSESFRVGPAELRDDLSVSLTRGGSLSGVVRDENDVPIPGVRIQVLVPPFADAWFPPGFDIGQQTSKTVVTADDGRYEMAGLWTGSYTFDLTHDRHVALTEQRVTLKELDEHVEHDFRMPIGRFLAGTCTNTDGTPAEGATVTITRPYADKVEARATVDQDGRWRMDGLVKGTYNVQARKEGYSSEILKEIPADTDNLHFRLLENGAIIGSVAGPDGAPIQRFMVALRPQDDGTPKSIQWSLRKATPARSFGDQGGNFHYQGIDPGEYIVTIRSSDYPDLMIENIRVPAGSAASVNGRMKDGGTLIGKVTNDAGQPVVDVVINVVRKFDRSKARTKEQAKASGMAFEGKTEDGGGGKNSARPSPDGTYRVKGLEPGEYFVNTTSTRHVAPARQTVVINEGQETRYDFAMSLAGQIAVTVTDDFGDPVLGAAVLLRDSSGRRPPSTRGGSRTNNAGALTITGVPSGELQLTVNRSGFIVKEISLSLQPGQSIEQAVRLERIR